MNILNKNYLQSDMDIQFDVITMNPPYQELKPGNKKSQPLWDKFVIKTIDNLIDGGYLVAVHPDGWRQPFGIFKDVQNKIKSKEILYLELHDVKDGIKTFGAETTYDFYCLHNVPNTIFTKIKCIDETIENADISKMEFIPNGMYNIFEKLIAKNGEEKVNIIVDSSYHTQRTEQMSEEQTEKFKYPCVYMTRKDGSIDLWFSKKNEKHFGISKVFWSDGRSCSVHIDENGEYGMTQFAFAIIDEIQNLPFIKKAMEHPNFLKLMYYSCGNTGQKYHRKFIKTFRKDFWKEFI
jgi:hypothetical protein